METFIDIIICLMITAICTVAVGVMFGETYIWWGVCVGVVVAAVFKRFALDALDNEDL